MSLRERLTEVVHERLKDARKAAKGLLVDARPIFQANGAIRERCPRCGRETPDGYRDRCSLCVNDGHVVWPAGARIERMIVRSSKKLLVPYALVLAQLNEILAAEEVQA